jgi:hypothetical protein
VAAYLPAHPPGLTAFTLKLSPARRSLYLISLVVALIGVMKLYRHWSLILRPFGTPFSTSRCMPPNGPTARSRCWSASS